jgi:hypothetical protein
MKAVCILFSIYLFALSAFACTDNHDRVSKCQKKEQVVQADAGNQHEEETCSPLCVCSCCGSVAVTFKYFDTNLCRVFVPYRHVVPAEFMLNDISFSVWQPPKLA